MENKFYLTSAIPYVNAAPHIGHAQEFVYSDVIKRYLNLTGRSVTYLCGADENALKIVQAAEKAGLSTQQFCDLHSKEFQDLAEKLNVGIEIWQRGSDKKYHYPSSQRLWEICNINGDIYKKSYTGLYCVGCEQFYTSDELDKNGECFEHPGRKLEKVEEENYFFRLSKYQSFLDDLISSGKLNITPEFRKNEVLSFLRQGLEDISISRSRERAKNWGVPVPNDPKQIMYVWFDALNIYQSGIGFGWNEEKYNSLIPQDLMVIGKGITRFHTIYWPAILKSANLPIPKSAFVHGYLTVDGQKMSKTLGNVIDPVMLIDKYGVDPLRYYLLKEIPSYSDGDFSERRFKEVYNSDLANNLGNLVSRVSKLSNNIGLAIDKPSKSFFDIYNKLDFRSFRENLEQFRFNEALNFISVQITTANKKIDETKPWILT